MYGRRQFMNLRLADAVSQSVQTLFSKDNFYTEVI